MVWFLELGYLRNCVQLIYVWYQHAGIAKANFTPQVCLSKNCKSMVQMLLNELNTVEATLSVMIGAVIKI